MQSRAPCTRKLSDAPGGGGRGRSGTIGRNGSTKLRPGDASSMLPVFSKLSLSLFNCNENKMSPPFLDTEAPRPRLPRPRHLGLTLSSWTCTFWATFPGPAGSRGPFLPAHSPWGHRDPHLCRTVLPAARAATALLGERPEEPTLVPLGVGPGCGGRQGYKRGVSAARRAPDPGPDRHDRHPHCRTGKAREPRKGRQAKVGAPGRAGGLRRDSWGHHTILETGGDRGPKQTARKQRCPSRTRGWRNWFSLRPQTCWQGLGLQGRQGCPSICL